MQTLCSHKLIIILSSYRDSGWLQGCKLVLWPEQLFSQSLQGLQNVSVFKRLWPSLPPRILSQSCLQICCSEIIILIETAGTAEQLHRK